MRNLSKFEEWSKFNDIEKIKYFIKSLAFKKVSDSSSKNQIFENNGNVVIIRENDY